MIINDGSLRTLYTAFNTAFREGVEGAPSRYRDIAMVVPSSTEEENYAWLGAMPGIREWVGDRHIQNLSISSYILRNKRFESTVSVERTKIEDDRFGVFGPIFRKYGRDTALHPDEMVFSLMSKGFTTVCYDGQYFFDADHPVGGIGDSPVASVSNVQDGEQTPWYLIDASQPIKPLIYQERMPFKLQRLDSDNDEHVMMKDEFIYGVRGRSNAGFGLWQLGFASKAELNTANYVNARNAMMSFKSDNGKPLNVMPTHLVVPPALEAPGRRILISTLNENGGTNEWAGTAQLIVTPYL